MLTFNYQLYLSSTNPFSTWCSCTSEPSRKVSTKRSLSSWHGIESMFICFCVYSILFYFVCKKQTTGIVKQLSSPEFTKLRLGHICKLATLNSIEYQVCMNLKPYFSFILFEFLPLQIFMFKAESFKKKNFRYKSGLKLRNMSRGVLLKLIGLLSQEYAY